MRGLLVLVVALSNNANFFYNLKCAFCATLCQMRGQRMIELIDRTLFESFSSFSVENAIIGHRYTRCLFDMFGGHPIQVWFFLKILQSSIRTFSTR